MTTLWNRTRTAILLLAISTAIAVAQVETSTVTGTVNDPSGAAVVGATVTLTNVHTGLVLSAATNSSGIYLFTLLQPGDYSVTAQQSGFEHTDTKLSLGVSQTYQVNLSLKVGQSSQTVDVQASNSAQLEPDTSGLDFLVPSKAVSDLPLSGRNPYALAALSPGVTPLGSFGAGLTVTRGAVVAAGDNNFMANGGIAGSNEILMDGVPITVCCQGQPAFTPSVELVDQLKVISSVPPAQFGRTSGGVLNIVTKSGTNDLHGSAYEFLGNDQLDAANYFAKRASHPPIPGRNDYRLPLRFNQFGATLGGPIIIPKLYHPVNKFYFFAGFEGVEARNAGYTTTTVPTALERQGVFTEAPNPIYNPTIIGAGPTRTLLPAVNGYAAGRAVPQSQFSPVAQAFLTNFYPMPNAPGISNNYNYLLGTQDQDRQYSLRLDHAFTPTQRSFARVTLDTNTHNQDDLFNHTLGANSLHQVLKAYVVTLDHVWAISANTAANFQYGFSYQKNANFPGNFFNFKASNYGFSPSFDAQQQIIGLPQIAVSGLVTIGGSNTDNNYVHYSHIVGISFILQRGKHTLTTGFDGRLILENENLVNNLGGYNFDSMFTNGPNPNVGVPAGQSGFDAWAAFLLGYPSSGSLTRNASLTLSQIYAAGYVQDDWKVSPRLTVNAGLRYDPETGMRERNNNWGYFDPSLANPLSAQTGLAFTGGTRYLNVNGAPGRTWETGWRNIGPRFGFAYAATPTTLVRGAYGILRLPTAERIFGSAPIGFAITDSYLASVDGFTPAGNIANPFPNGVVLPQGSAGGVTQGAGTAITSALYNTPPSYIQQWNFGIQQGLTSHMLFTLGYAGSHAVKLPLTASPNNLNPKYFGAVGDKTQVAYLQQLVANPFYGHITSGVLAQRTIQRFNLLAAYPQYTSLGETYAPLGSASYNAMQATLTSTGDHGLTYSLGYTWSKELGNVSNQTTGFLDSTGVQNYQNYYVPQIERSVLPADLPQRIQASVLYDLPFGKGQRFAGSAGKLLDQAIGGWEVNAILAAQKGFPLSIIETGQPAFSGTRPNLVPGVNPATPGNNHDRLKAYLNPAAFTLTQSFQLGNEPRSSALLRAPGGFQDDFTLLKTFHPVERLGVQFRVEAFNLLNKVQFSYPGTTFGSTTFGVISGQSNTPRQLEGALTLLW